MDIVRQLRPRAWILIAVVSAGISFSASAEDPESSAKQLETLLQELRQTRIHQRDEAQAAAREGRALGQVQAQKERQLAELRREIAQRRKELAVRREEQNRQRQAVDALRSDVNASEQRLRTLAQQLLDQIKVNPRLATPDQQDALQTIATAEIDGDQQAILFWNTLLAMAVRGVETRVDQRLIQVGDQKLAVNVLRLGTIGTLWLTADESRGGLSERRQDKLQWVELPDAELPAIVHAFRVARGEQPAELVTVPVEAGKPETAP